jgi:TRAP-type C4-dicarboxylate transport system permease small subunit
MGAAYTQVHRGHVGIEILENILSRRANRWRDLIGALLSAVVCAVLAWQTWSLFAEAWTFNYITESTWAPKLWVPYFFMALGLTMLGLQLVVQILEDLAGARVRPPPRHPEENE